MVWILHSGSVPSRHLTDSILIHINCGHSLMFVHIKSIPKTPAKCRYYFCSPV